jgi:voltage-gated potassium channel
MGLTPALLASTERMPRFALLLAGMLLELMLSPLIGASAQSLYAGRIVEVVVLLGGLSVVGGRRVTTVALFVPALLAQVASGYSGSATVLAVAIALRLLFLGHVCILLIRHVLREPRVTFDTIAGAACAYMILGLAWGDLYWLVDFWHPGAFEIPTSFSVTPLPDRRAPLMYFSFVTLTTIGYGVVHPANPAVGGLCVAEALVGQFYLGIMIARMVGLHIVDRAR